MENATIFQTIQHKIESHTCILFLEYQSTCYFFDEDYKIRLMDMNCNIIELDSNMYTLITETGYELKNEVIFPEENYYNIEKEE